MAKIGLNYGEKLQIADKTYRVITEGLNVPEVLGKLSFRGIEGPDIIFEEVLNATLTALSSKSTQEKSVGSLLRFTLLSSMRPSFSPLLIWHSLKLKT